MKKLLLLALSVGLLSFTSASNLVNLPTAKEVVATIAVECNYGQCYATAKSTGNRCKHCVSNSGDSFCYQHKPK